MTDVVEAKRANLREGDVSQTGLGGESTFISPGGEDDRRANSRRAESPACNVRTGSAGAGVRS
jgi:hypothetical protein